ncbi:class I SAM-dependent methyltransferase [Nocardia terpenica]|uniref:Methyltransferase domain-containing protein n=1 Tax=Nocardia terpenica TaxID=455432 RepID=A0A6G9ZCA2_9NOCA|nr:class I SAM-dependent methyltransferase [Nocardia terpenica]QIS22776.1 methyltransferase domain-containing protein [Nocardia terpenica]
MSTSKLAAGGVADAERLRGIANTTDSHTRAVLESLPAPSAARVLDIGAGTGSVARWMATERWPQGRVLAVDQDVAIMTGEQMPANCEVLRADVRELAPRTGSFDVVHARFVLLHLPDRDDVTALAASLLDDGGHLVVTEPYALGTGGLYPVVDEVMDAYNAYAAAVGMDLHWSKTVPGLVSELGLSVVAVETAAGRLGGGPGKDRWAPMIARVRDDLIAAGLATDTLAEFERLCARPDVYDVPQVMITTVAVKSARS